jgi:hypothetical protein
VCEHRALEKICTNWEKVTILNKVLHYSELSNLHLLSIIFLIYGLSPLASSNLAKGGGGVRCPAALEILFVL